MLSNELFASLAILLTIIGVIPYVIGIFKGTVKPHAFSWFIWCLLAAIGSSAQYSAGAGPGSWTLAFGSLICVFFTILAIWKGTRNITRTDWLSFILALSAIPLWIITNDPLWSVILVAGIDTVAYWPTIRKSWYFPHQELIFTYLTGVMKHLLSLLAMAEYSLTTCLYPATIASTSVVLIMVLVVRRRVITCQ